MGLDIIIDANNYKELDSNGHTLSRTFCNFMSRRDQDLDHEPELDQIGEITGIDISPIYEMNSYPAEGDGYLEYRLESADSEEERQRILKEVEDDKAKLKGNIDKVLRTITDLIEKLNSITNLPSLLLPTEEDLLDNEDYFSEFQIDKGNGYIGNNFGRDLRNFKKFLEYAKEKGTTTVWFDYG